MEKAGDRSDGSKPPIVFNPTEGEVSSVQRHQQQPLPEIYPVETQEGKIQGVLTAFLQRAISEQHEQPKGEIKKEENGAETRTKEAFHRTIPSVGSQSAIPIAPGSLLEPETSEKEKKKIDETAPQLTRLPPPPEKKPRKESSESLTVTFESGVAAKRFAMRRTASKFLKKKPEIKHSESPVLPPSPSTEKKEIPHDTVPLLRRKDSKIYSRDLNLVELFLPLPKSDRERAIKQMEPEAVFTQYANFDVIHKKISSEFEEKTKQLEKLKPNIDRFMSRKESKETKEAVDLTEAQQQKLTEYKILEQEVKKLEEQKNALIDMRVILDQKFAQQLLVKFNSGLSDECREILKDPKMIEAFLKGVKRLYSEEFEYYKFNDNLESIFNSVAERGNPEEFYNLSKGVTTSPFCKIFFNRSIDSASIDGLVKMCQKSIMTHKKEGTSTEDFEKAYEAYKDFGKSFCFILSRMKFKDELIHEFTDRIIILTQIDKYARDHGLIVDQKLQVDQIKEFLEAKSTDGDPKLLELKERLSKSCKNITKIFDSIENTMLETLKGYFTEKAKDVEEFVQSTVSPSGSWSKFVQSKKPKE